MLPTGKVTGVSQVTAELGSLTDHTLARVTKTVTRLAIEMVAYVKGSKLSGQVLKNRTGTLRRSITHKVTSDKSGVNATVGTNVAYAAIHEYGFSGTVTVKAHTRNITQVYGRAVEGVLAQVNEHSRKVNMPERSYLRSSLAEKAASIRQQIIETASLNLRSKE